VPHSGLRLVFPRSGYRRLWTA